MVLKLAIVFSLTLVIVHGFGLSPAFRTPQFDLNRAKNCTQQGFMCDDCKTLVFCYQGGNGTWIKEPVEICAANQSCSSTIEPPACSSTPDAGCDIIGNVDIECHQIGTFPHPYDCTRYYRCISVDGVNIEPPMIGSCKTGYGYDPLTTLCKNRLVDGKCSKQPVKTCTSVGTLGAIEGNPHLYSLCLLQKPNATRAVYIPHIFLCSDDEQFDGTGCKKPQLGLNENKKCTAIGNFFNPELCKMYNECTAIGNDPIARTCTVGNRFNPITRACEQFRCL